MENVKKLKEDVCPFLQEPTQPDLWSIGFFRHWISLLKFE